MEWLESIRKTIDILEKTILDSESAESAVSNDSLDFSKIARQVGISQFYLQKGFSLMTGFSMAEYVRNRRLYLSALDILKNCKVIDVAYKFGYDTPESFSKAFTRFHGVSPLQLKNEPHKIKSFLPLAISITIQGGNRMDYRIEEENEFTVIGFEREINFDRGYSEIPKFWNEISEKYLQKAMQNKNADDKIGEAIRKNKIGTFGVCIDDNQTENFRYMIAGRYDGDKVPDGMKLYTFPKATWAKFVSRGPLPGALQSLNTKIFREWLPGNTEWEIALGANIEYYTDGDNSADNYKSEIWIPVKKK